MVKIGRNTPLSFGIQPVIVYYTCPGSKRISLVPVCVARSKPLWPTFLNSNSFSCISNFDLRLKLNESRRVASSYMRTTRQLITEAINRVITRKLSFTEIKSMLEKVRVPYKTWQTVRMEVNQLIAMNQYDSGTISMVWDRCIDTGVKWIRI